MDKRKRGQHDDAAFLAPTKRAARDRADDDDADDDYDAALLEADGMRSNRERRKGLFDLDEESDEEDEDSRKKRPEKERSKSMRVGDVVGQEDSTEQFDEDGAAIEPFNMKEEFQLGDMDESGTYKLKKDAHEANDPWLNSITNDDIRKAAAAQAAANKAAEEAGTPPPRDTSELLQVLISALQPGEPTVRAVKRLGGSRPSAAQRWSKKGKEAAAAAAETQSEGDKALFAAVIEAADGLLSAGFADIYSEPREVLETRLRQLKASEASVRWEYKWTADATEKFGPFSSVEMHKWNQAGLFGDAVVARRYADGNNTANFNSIRRLDFELYIDDDASV